MAQVQSGSIRAGVPGKPIEPEQLRLFAGAGTIDLAALRMERAALMQANWSKNTQRAFAADWRDKESW